MKIIFLDIDGVLNSVEHSVGMKNYHHDMFRMDEADPVKIGLLRFVCEQTDAKIVISSSWRIGRTKDWFIGYFERARWPMPPVYGMTPTDARIGKRGRGDEINQWRDDHMSPEDKDPWVIIDDDSDFYEWQPFVKTNGVYGLTLKETLKMIDILGPGKNANLLTIESLRTHVDFVPRT